MLEHRCSHECCHGDPHPDHFEDGPDAAQAPLPTLLLPGLPLRGLGIDQGGCPGKGAQLARIKESGLDEGDPFPDSSSRAPRNDNASNKRLTETSMLKLILRVKPS